MKRVCVKVKSHIGEEWWGWFGGLAIDHRTPQQTLVHGPLPDMAAVYGLLETIRNLGLEIISVHMESDSGTLELASNGEPRKKKEE